MEKTLVIAKSVGHFVRYQEALPANAVYCSDVVSLMGKHGGNVILLEGCSERSDWKRIKAELRYLRANVYMLSEYRLAY